MREIETVQYILSVLKLEYDFSLPSMARYFWAYKRTQRLMKRLELTKPRSGYIHKQYNFPCEEEGSDEDISPHHYNITL